MGKLGGGAVGYGGAAVIGALALAGVPELSAPTGERPRRARAGEPATRMRCRTRNPPPTAARSSSRSCVRWSVPRKPTDTSTRRSSGDCSRKSSGLRLDAEAKAYVFDLLTHDVDLKSLVDAVRTPEQGAELYLAARLAIDPDEPAERAYLDALAARLRLPAELRSSLDSAPQKTSA